jgi:hypothetical protein
VIETTAPAFPVLSAKVVEGRVTSAARSETVRRTDIFVVPVRSSLKVMGEGLGEVRFRTEGTADTTGAIARGRERQPGHRRITRPDRLTLT